MTQNTKQQERITSLAKFQKEITALGYGSFVYRGQSDENWKGVQSTAYRRLCNLQTDEPNNSDLIICNERLINIAKKNYENLSNKTNLNILAQLQHFGAATILIDFSYSALMALWFACQNDKTDAKVFCLDISDEKFFKINNLNKEKQSIRDILNGKDNNSSKDKGNEQKPDYENFKNIEAIVWEPSLIDNRIIKQDSVFVFNQLGIVKDTSFIKTLIILKKYKKTILKDLETLTGITETRIFPDLYGFAQSNSFNKTYENKTEFADIYYHQGIENFEQKKFDQAIEDFNKAISLNPKFADAYYKRGNAYYILKHFTKAVEDYTQTIKHYTKNNPKLINAYYNRGNVYIDLIKFDQAIEDFNEVIKLNSKDIRAYNNRGIVYAYLEHFTKAVEDFDKAISLNPKFAEAYYNRGLAYASLKKYKKAIENYTKAITLNPKHAKAYNNRGNMYDKLGEFEEAIQNYTQTIKLDPKHAGAYNNRGIVCATLGECEKAVEDFDKTISLNPKFADAYKNRGLAYERLGKFEEAIQDITQAKYLYTEQGNMDQANHCQIFIDQLQKKLTTKK